MSHSFKYTLLNNEGECERQTERDGTLKEKAAPNLSLQTHWRLLQEEGGEAAWTPAIHT